MFDQLYELGCFYVTVTGGEPLLRKDLLDILDYSRQYGEAQIHILFTNGSLWTREFFGEFMRIYHKQPLRVQISLDGYSYETYSATRGGTPQDFERVLRTIRWLRQAEVPLSACYTVTKKNIGYTLKTARWALEDLGVDSIHVIPLFVTGRAIKNYEKLMFTFEEWKTLVKDITVIKRDRLWDGMENRLSLGFHTWYQLVYPLEQQGLTKEIETVWNMDKEEFTSMFREVFCEAGITDLCVLSNGDVYPCTPATGTEFVLGNVQETSLEDIWETSPMLQWFRTDAREAGKKEPCRSCPYSDVCSGGCRVSALALSHDKTAPDPRCPIVKEYQTR
jgi:radical SAM protein with 4Fe4S-binding SPASM domain